MVARSIGEIYACKMSFVSTDIFTAALTGMTERLAQMEGRLNELFTTVDKRFNEHAEIINNTSNQIPVIVSKMEKIEGETPGKLREIMEEHRNFVIEKTRQADANSIQLNDVVRQMQEVITTVRMEVNVLGATSAQSGGSSQPRGLKPLLDPKSFALTKYDGSPGEKEDFEEWRDDMEEYLETYRSNIKPILQKAARFQHEITRSNFEDVVHEAKVDPHSLQWSFDTVTEEIYTFMKKFLKGRAKKAFVTSSHGGFEAYRTMVKEIDPINHRTKAALTDNLTGMIRNGSSKDFRTLKNRLLEMEAICKMFRKRTNEEPEASLLASILSNILDSKTRETFTHDHLLGNYAEMKTRIMETATEADVGNGIKPMDVGNVDVERAVPTYQMDTPVTSPTKSSAQGANPGTNASPGGNYSPTADPNLNFAGKGGEKGKSFDPTKRCYSCNELGHPSFLCPHKKGGAKGGGKAAYGQNGGYGQNSGYGQNGGMWKGLNAKGGGKGKQGKGQFPSKGYGKGAYALDEWNEYSQEDWEYYSGMCLSLEEETSVCEDDFPPLPPPLEMPPTSSYSRPNRKEKMKLMPYGGSCCDDDECSGTGEHTVAVVDLHSGDEEGHRQCFFESSGGASSLSDHTRH